MSYSDITAAANDVDGKVQGFAADVALALSALDAASRLDPSDNPADITLKDLVDVEQWTNQPLAGDLKVSLDEKTAPIMGTEGEETSEFSADTATDKTSIGTFNAAANEDVFSDYNASLEVDDISTTPDLNWWGQYFDGGLPAIDLSALNDMGAIFNSNYFLEHSYQSDFLDYIEAKCTDLIESGNETVDTLAQQALFYQELQRDIQMLNDAVDKVDRDEARRGFPKLNSRQLYNRNRPLLDFHKKYSDKNKEVYGNISTRAEDIHNHAINIGLKVEELRRTTALALDKLYWGGYNALLKKYSEDLRKIVVAKQMEVEYLLALAKQEEAEADLQIKRKEQESQAYNSSAEVNLSNIKTDIEASQEELKANTNDAANQNRLNRTNVSVKELNAEMHMRYFSNSTKRFFGEALFQEQYNMLAAKYAELDQEKKVECMMAAVEEMQTNIETWKKSYSGTLEAMKQKVDHYSAQIAGWTGTLNKIDSTSRTG